MHRIPCDIGVDLDGVVYDNVKVTGRHAAAKTGRPRDEFPPATTWEFWNEWGLTLAQFLELMTEGVLAGELFWEGDIYPTVAPAWQQLKAAGHRIHVVTDRSPAGAVAEAHAATRHWLAANGLEYDTLTFDRDKTRVLEHTDGNRVVFIEDRPANILALTAAGVTTYCQRRPYNLGHDFAYVDTFAEFAELAAAA